MGDVDMFALDGRVAIVTGAGRGLGRGYANALAKAGARVICADVRDDDLEQTVAGVRESGGEAEARIIDVTDITAVRSAIGEIERAHGHLDVVVNNAGTEIAKDADDVLESDFDTIIGVNLKGTYFVAQAAAKVMKARKAGKIINIGSLGSQIGLAGSTVYCSSKGGVLLFTRALAIELAPHNVQVNAIGPGYFRTPMTEPFFQDLAHNEWIANRIPAGRVGTTDDLAGTVVFLASKASDYITGQIIYVDGGWLAS